MTSNFDFPQNESIFEFRQQVNHLILSDTIQIDNNPCQKKEKDNSN